MTKQYTISQMEELKPYFKSMLIMVMNDVLENTLLVAQTKYTRVHVIDETQFHWEINCLNIPHQDNLGTVVQAKLQFGNERHFEINFDSNDFFNLNLPESYLDDMTERFMIMVALHMTRSWYSREGMQERITNLAEQKEFHEISKYVDTTMQLRYDDFGYEVSIWDNDSRLISQDVHRSIEMNRNLTDTNFHIFLRYLDNGVITMLAAEKVWKDKWSQPLL